MPATLVRLPMLAIVFVFAAELAFAQFSNSGEVRPGDEVWLVNSRSSGSTSDSLESLRVSRAIGNGQWQPASVHDLLASDQPMVVYLHGNRVGLSQAMKRGGLTYKEMFVAWCAVPPPPPVRFVIWAWPADQIPGPIRDFRMKAEVADCHAVHVAKFLTALPQGTYVNVIGFSYGGRMAVGAMHVYSGGRLKGRTVPNIAQRQHNISLTLFAPAIRNDCFSCGYERALSNVDQLFLLYNSNDPLLKFYRLAQFDDRRDALGYTGMTGRISSATVVRQRDAKQSVGAAHDYLEYIRDPQIERMVHQNLIFPIARP